MKLEQLLKTTPETLAIEQHDALKAHVINVLESTLQAVRDEYYNAIQKMTMDSPAGDGMGCDNNFINFGYEDNKPLDIYEVMERLIELKKIAKKK
jgi:uncharacterized protein (UPF0297 family)